MARVLHECTESDCQPTTLNRTRNENSSNSEVIENVGTPLPRIGAVVLLLNLVVESVNMSNLARLVVTTQERNLVRVTGNDRE